MDEKAVFKMVNSLLEATDYPLEIKNVNDLTDFLNDENNKRFEQYAEIGRLYDHLVSKPEIDRSREV